MTWIASILLWPICLTLSFAVVHPEIPKKRTSVVFSPFDWQFPDAGENVIKREGPAALKYLTVDMSDEAPPIPDNQVATVELFLEELAGNAGIFFIVSHGSTDLIAVESYQESNLPEANNRARQLRELYSATTSQIGVFSVSKIDGVSGFTIALSKDFIANRVGDHGIVQFVSCFSDSFRDTIIKDGGAVRVFIGVQGLFFCGGETHAEGFLFSQALYNGMSGINSINGQFLNFPFDPVFTVAQGAVLNTNFTKKLDSTSPSPANLRLFNAPRLVFAELREDADQNGTYENLVYRFVFGHDIYP